MTNKEFINKYPLQRDLPINAVKAFEDVLIEASKSHAIEWVKEKSIKVDDNQYYLFSIVCHTINFADAYAHIGMLFGLKVLPIINPNYK